MNGNQKLELYTPNLDTHEDRRVLDRLDCIVHSLCHPIHVRHCHETWIGHTQDISERGVAIVVNRRFEPGTILVLELLTPDRRPAHHLLIQVVRAVPQDEGNWLMGCAFHGGPTLDQIRLLADGENPNKIAQ